MISSAYRSVCVCVYYMSPHKIKKYTYNLISITFLYLFHRFPAQLSENVATFV